MKTIAKRADEVFSKYIKERDKVCLRCGSSEFGQCAHVFTRGYKQIRWDVDNAVRLCRGCHLYFTHHPIQWEDFIKEKFPGRWEVLRSKALEYHKKIDHKEIIKSLS